MVWLSGTSVRDIAIPYLVERLDARVSGPPLSDAFRWRRRRVVRVVRVVGPVCS